MTVVSAAGNSNIATGSIYPGAYGNVLAVAALLGNGAKASYSNYGNWIDISIPIGYIVGTSDYYGSPAAGYGNLYWENYNGTSAATAYAAGVIGLLYSLRPNIKPAEVESILKSTAISTNIANPAYVDLLGAGRVSAKAAVATAAKKIFFQQQSTGQPLFWSLSGLGAANVVTSNFTPFNNPNIKIVDVTDFNNDGNPDLLWQDSVNSAVYIWFLDRSGGIITSSVVNPPANQPTGVVWKVVATGKVNNDSTPDIILQNQNTAVPAVWFISPQGALTNGYVLGSGNPMSTSIKIVDATDIDGNGSADLVFWDGLTAYTWFLNSSGVAINAKVMSTAGESGWELVGTGKVNNDATPDLIFQKITTTGGVTNTKTAVWTVLPDGTPSTTNVVSDSNSTSSSIYKIIDINDVNGDGVVDYVWQANTGETAMWLLNPNLTFNSAFGISSTNLGADWKALGIGKFN
jgi:Subtilase family